MTQEVKYRRTYAALRESMPAWGTVRDAPTDKLEGVLSDAGLAHTKATQIQAILTAVERREGRLDLGRLRTLEDDDIERYLTSLPGVGRKTARCVMLYALGREACPVDTHVWRVMRRLGFAPDASWSEQRSKDLELTIPVSLRASLHRTLVSHGRAVCRARSPRCPVCAISTHCPAASQARSSTPANARKPNGGK
jgi:endonuclease III